MAVAVILSMTSCCKVQESDEFLTAVNERHDQAHQRTCLICKEWQGMVINLDCFLSLPFGSLVSLAL